MLYESTVASFGSKINGEVASSACPPNPNIMGGSTGNLAIDTLDICLDVDSSLSHIFGYLRSCKDELQSTDFSELSALSFDRGDDVFVWALQRTGSKLYPYVLKSGDISLCISSRKKGCAIPPFKLHIGSVSCQNSVKNVYGRVVYWLSLQRVEVVSNLISRVDICADIIGQDIKEGDVWNEDFYVMRARSSALYREHRKVTGVQLGKGDIVLRMYDKLVELRKPHNSEKRDFFFEKWCCVPESVTRVEYQLRRGALKEFGSVNTLDDLFVNMGSLWRYLTCDWFRHVAASVDRKNFNQNTVPVSAFWSVVQGFTAAVYSLKRVVKKSVFKSFSMLRAQFRGILTTLCAGMGHSGEDYFGILATVSDLAQAEMAKAMNDSVAWDRLFKARAVSTVLCY